MLRFKFYKAKCHDTQYMMDDIRVYILIYINEMKDFSDNNGNNC